MKRYAGLVIAVVFALPLGVVFSIAVLGGASLQAGCGAAVGPSAAGEPPLIQYYIAAASRFGLGSVGYAYLAAINHVETGFGTNLAVSSAGAVGWMQFEPGTFARYGVSITAPSAAPDPYDPQDAIYTAARYLNASGAPADWSTAILAYNHSDAYVTEVEGLAQRYSGQTGLQNLRADIQQYWGSHTSTPGPGPQFVANTIPLSTSTTTGTTTSQTGSGAGTDGFASGGCCADAAGTTGTTGTGTGTSAPGSTIAVPASSARGCSSGPLVLDVLPVPGKVAVIMPNGLARPPAAAPAAVQAMVAAGDRIHTFDYQWGGGHANPAMSDSQTNPQPQGGGRPGDNGTNGYDCSGATAYVLFGGGLGSYFGGAGGSVPGSGDFGGFGQPGAGRWVTWYFNAGHVFIEVAGIVLDTGHQFPAQPTIPSTGPRWTIAADVAAQQAGDGPFTAQHPEGL